MDPLQASSRTKLLWARCIVVGTVVACSAARVSAKWFADLYSGATDTQSRDVTLIVRLPGVSADHTFHGVKWDKSPSFGGRAGYWFVNTGSMLALMLMVSGNSAWAAVNMIVPDEHGIQRATITMDSYSYSPKELIVQAGQPVEFTLHNAATFTPHTFVVDDPAAGLHLRTEVSAGDSQTLRFTPMQSGSVTFYCDKQLLFFKTHRERGQEGHLEVR